MIFKRVDTDRLSLPSSQTHRASWIIWLLVISMRNHVLIQRILNLGHHIVTLLKFHLNQTHMAPFSVNITRRVWVGLGLG